MRQLTRLGLLGSVAAILFVLEGLAPRPLPWMKLGLGNLPVVVSLLLYGGSAALGVAAVKVAIGGLLSGGLAGPAFVIGGGASLASVVVMAAIRRHTGSAFSPIGLSVLGAVAHQLTQLLIAWQYVGHVGLFSLVPLFLLTGLLSGALIGLLAYWSWRRLARADGLPGGPDPPSARV
ncbi:MAG: Gx transporter family protein [Candidatus Latescibacterota bacterium]